jgi:hypothetical protein
MCKICNKCKLEKDLEEFYNDSYKKDGKKTICKECSNKSTNIRRSKEKLIKLNLKKELILTNKKICNNCKKEKYFYEFHKSLTCKNGCRTTCKECSSKKYKEKYIKETKIVAKLGKICIKCNNDKELIHFYACKDITDGYRNVCKKCINEQRRLKNKKIKEIKDFKIKVVVYKKICNKCKEEKQLEDFHKKCDSKDGYRTSCKDCCNKDTKERRLVEDKEKHKLYIQNRYNEKKEYILQQKKEYYLNNREKILKQKEKYRKENPNMNKNWRKNNKEKLNFNSVKYRKNNKHIVIWRSLVYRTIKYFNTIKEKHTIDMLGYSALEFKEHIEKQFLHDMNWNNYGELWEIDHIYPLSRFDKNTNIKIVNALNNLRPLYLELNREKSNKIF